MKRPLKIILIAVPCLLVVLLVGAYLGLNLIVRTAVRRVLPRVTGTPVRLDGVSVRPFSGRIEIHGLAIGNPEGFKTDTAFEFSHVRVRYDAGSVFSDTIRVREILIADPKVTYEQSLQGSNIGRIRKHVESAKGPKEDAPLEAPEEGKEGKEGKKVIIDLFQMTNAQVRVASAELGVGHTATMGEVTIRDIGRESGGVTAARAAFEVLGPISDNVERLAESVRAAVEKGAEEVKGVVTEAGKKAGEAAEAIGKEAGGLLKGVLEPLRKEEPKE